MKKTQWKEDLYLTVKVVQQKLAIYYSEVTLRTGQQIMSVHIINPFKKRGLFRKWVKTMDINPDDETSYITKYQKAFLKYVVNEYCAKHQRLSIIQSENVPSNDL